MNPQTIPWKTITNLIGKEDAVRIMRECWQISKDVISIPKKAFPNMSICKHLADDQVDKLVMLHGGHSFCIPRKGSKFACGIDPIITKIERQKEYKPSKASTKDGIKRSMLKMIKEDRQARLLGMSELCDIFPLGEIQDIKNAFLWARNEANNLNKP